MRNYTILRKPENLDWSTIPAASIDNLLWTPSVDITSQAQLCYDEEAIYVRLSAKEANIRAEENGPLGTPCQDSCLEFFFAPIEGDDRYMNVEFSSTGCLFLGIGSNRYNIVRLLPQGNPFQAAPALTADGWEIVYQIPVSFIRQFFPAFEAYEGLQFYGNFYRSGEKAAAPYGMSWHPIEPTGTTFHCPEYFGQLILGGEEI